MTFPSKRIWDLRTSGRCPALAFLVHGLPSIESERMAHEMKEVTRLAEAEKFAARYGLEKQELSAMSEDTQQALSLFPGESVRTFSPVYHLVAGPRWSGAFPIELLVPSGLGLDEERKTRVNDVGFQRVAGTGRRAPPCHRLCPMATNYTPPISRTRRSPNEPIVKPAVLLFAPRSRGKTVLPMQNLPISSATKPK